MKYRKWLLEALRLHFDEKLPRTEGGRRLGIPNTTICDLFVRFRQAGLSWPLPANITDMCLDKRLYQQPSRKGKPPSAPLAQLSVIHKPARRPNFPHEFKIALVKQSMQPGVSVAQLARENDINDNLLFNWRRRYQQEVLVAQTEAPVMLPVTLTAESGSGQTQTQPIQSDDALCCELALPAGTLRISGKLTPELLQMLIREMQGESR
ncbi:transposase [Edwardsiella piscicida]|nr:transposase [Edwardsiella piscicida]